MNKAKKVNLHMPKLSVLSMSVSLAISATAFAQNSEEKGQDKSDNQAIETVRVEGKQYGKYAAKNAQSHKYTQPLMDTPKTINIIGEELLRDQNIDSLNDALRNVAGVSTFGAGEGGGGDLTTNDTITIRGFDADSSIYIDNIRDVAGYSRDLFNVEAIEVAKGGSGSITGKGSAGGTLSLVTKKARQENFGFVDISANTVDNRRVHLDYNTPINSSLAARINLLVSDGQDPLDNGVVEYNSYGVAPSLALKISQNTFAELSMLFMQQDNTPSLGLPYVTQAVSDDTGLPVGPIDKSLWSNYYGVASRDFEKVDVSMGTLIVNHEFSEDARLRFATRIAQNHKQSITGRPNFLNEGTRSNPDYTNALVSTALVVPGLAYIDARDEKNDLFVTQLDGIFSFDTGAVEHDVVLGSEYYVDQLTKPDISSRTVKLSSLGVSLYNPDQNITFTGAYQALPNPAKTKGKGLAVYALDTIKFNDSWLFSLGARWENYELKGSQYYTVSFVTRERALATGLQSDVNLFSWNMGLVYKPRENGSIYISAANSQEPLGGNLRFSGRNKASFKERASLDPEDSTSYELGTKWELFDNQLVLNAAVFQTTKTILDSASRSAPVNLSGEQTSKGVELSAVGQINEALSVSANYTHLDTKVTKTAQTGAGDLGNGLSAAPDDTASLWINYQPNFMQEKLQLGAGLSYSSGDTFYRSNRAYFNTGSYSVWNILAAYKLTDKIKLQLNVDNVFDEEYITDFSARGHFRPGTPRYASFKISYDF